MRNAIDVWAAVRAWDLEHPEVAVPGTFGAPRTPFNQPISARRAVSFTGTTLDALDKLRRDTGSTVNDVVLAIVGGALRRYLHPRAGAAGVAAAGDGAGFDPSASGQRPAATSCRP